MSRLVGSPAKTRRVGQRDNGAESAGPEPKTYVEVNGPYRAAIKAEEVKDSQWFKDHGGKLKDVVKGGKYYVIHELDIGETKEDWLLYCECIHVEGDVRKMHYAAWREEDDGVYVEDWEVGAEEAAQGVAEVYEIAPEMVEPVKEPSQAEWNLASKITEYLEGSTTIKRAGNNGKRKEVLALAIEDLVKDGYQVDKGDDEDIKDVIAKRVEEHKGNLSDEEAAQSLGRKPANLKVVKGYFEQCNGEEEEKREGKEDQMKEVLARLKKLTELVVEVRKENTDMAKKMDRIEGKVVIQQVQKVARGTKELDKAIEKEQEKEAEEPKGGIVDTQRDGDCKYHALSGLDEIAAGKKPRNLEYTQKKVEGVKNTIVYVAADCMEFLRRRVEKEDGMDKASKEEKEDWVQNRFVEMVGEGPNDFVERLTNGGGNQPAKRQGGAIEAGMATKDSNVRVITLWADAFHKGADREKAMKEIYRMAWPGENEKEYVVFHVNKRRHVWWGVVNRGDEQNAIFKIGAEADEAIKLIVDYLMQSDPPQSVLKDLSSLKDQERKEAIANMRKRPDRSQSGGDDEQGGWQQARRGREKGRKQVQQHVQWQGEKDWGRAVEVRMVAQEEPPKSALVVWTSKSTQELSDEMTNKFPNVAKMVVAARQANKHVVLKATEANWEELRASKDTLRRGGLDVKLFHHKQAGLAQDSRRGLGQQVRGAGVCNYFLDQKQCPFGDRCRFRCYGYKQKGWV